jgi:hypothetical protein
MEIKEAKFEDLQRENPALVECIRKDILEGDEFKQQAKELKELKEKQAAMDLKEKQTAQATKVSEWLKESKLPEIVKGRIAKTMSEKLIEVEKDLREAFDVLHKSELEFVNQLSGKGKIKTTPVKEAEGGDAVKTATEGLMERMGIEKDEKKKPEEK